MLLLLYDMDYGKYLFGFLNLYLKLYLELNNLIMKRIINNIRSVIFESAHKYFENKRLDLITACSRRYWQLTQKEDMLTISKAIQNLDIITLNDMYRCNDAEFLTKITI